MKAEDIEIGKKYWIRFASDPTIATVIAKRDGSNQFIVHIGYSITTLREPNEFYSPYKPPFSIFNPWTWFSK